MKNRYTLMSLPVVLLLLTVNPGRAQDSSKNAIKIINKTSEQADNLHGKKIQQESLPGKQFEKLVVVDTITTAKTTRKKTVKRKKHQQ